MPNYPLIPMNTTLLPQFQEWTDKYGLMQDNDQGNTTGNGVLFTAHYVFGLVSNKLLTDAEKCRLLSVFESCVQKDGILMRTPDNGGGHQAHDDLLGLMSAEAMLVPNKADRRLTKLIYAYGKNAKIQGIDPAEGDPKKIKLHKWLYPVLKVLGLGKIWYCWNNVSPGMFHASSWLHRRPEVIATMQMQQNKWLVNPIYWAYWAVTMLTQYYIPGDKTYRDGYTLRFHSAIVCQDFGPISRWISNKVRAAVARDYKDFGFLLSEYFQKPQHPIVALCTDKV